MEVSYPQVEEVAAWICHQQGGKWDAPKTHRNHWRRKAAALIALATIPDKEAAMAEARKIMETRA